MPTSSRLLRSTLVLLAACSTATPAPVARTITQRSLQMALPVATANPLAQHADAIEATAAKAVPAVVFIHSHEKVDPREGAMPFMFGPQGLMLPNQPRIREGAGSGVLVDPDGLILTNFHVIRNALDLEVTLSDGRRFKAKVVGTDEPTDLALIRLQGDVPTDLPTLTLGDSDTLKLGQTVLAIGAPFALQGSVTLGIISARGRAGMGLSSYENFIQTDAAINPGNSGGALVSLDGQLIGINTAISSRSGGYDGIGFAIPSNLAAQIMPALKADGRVIRGFLGVGIQDVDPSFASTFRLDPSAHGALINHVEPGTPAEAAGLRVGDVITSLDGTPIESANALRNTVSLRGAKQEIRLGLIRDGKPIEVKARLAHMPDEADTKDEDSAAHSEGLLQGLRLASIGEVGSRLGPDAPHAGAVVVAVEPGCVGDRAGLAPGDVIVEVDRKTVESPADAKRALSSREKALLLVQRGDTARFVFLE